MIRISRLAVRYGTRYLFSGVDLQLAPGERYGLVGPNGSGKTTFLDVLSGRKTDLDEGGIQLPAGARVGTLGQDQYAYDHLSLLEAVYRGRPDMLQARERLAELLSGKHAFDEDRAADCAHLEAEYAALGGYRAKGEAARILVGLGLPQERHERPVGELSGGFRLRVLLAQVLFGEPDVLLLDEPTNHLDIYSILWLEQHLKKFRGILVITSHDRLFINSLATAILDVDYGTITMVRGDYDHFQAVSAERRAYQEAVLEKNEKRREELQRFVDRFRAKATKARQAQSKERLIDKLEDEMEANELQASSRRPPRLRFAPARASGRSPLVVRGLAKSYGEHKVLAGIDLEVERGDRLAILGANGTGKSTFLKVVMGLVPPDAGDFRWGHQADVAYFPQDIEQVLDPQATVLEWLRREIRGNDTELRGALGAALFSGDSVDHRIGTLSGGEKARAILARIMLQKPNVLVMDEPTNHLDLEAVDALRESLLAFDGTLLFVSHNRWFVSGLATRLLEVTPQGMRDFRGTYDGMLEQAGADHLSREVSLRARTPSPGGAAAAEAVDPKEAKRVLRQRQNALKKTEEAIAGLEARLARIGARTAEESFYRDTPVQERNACFEEEARLRKDLEARLAEWERQAADIEAVERA